MKTTRSRGIQLPRIPKLLNTEAPELIENGALIIETITPLFLTFSIEYIIKHHIAINDAIHLYTALTWAPEIDQFICSDKNLIKAAESENLKILNPDGV